MNTRYTYDTLGVGHMQLSQTRTRRSDGSTLLTQMTYPADYTAVTTGPLAAMRSNAVFQHTAVVESTTRVYGASQTAADAKTISGNYTEYGQPNATSRFLPVSSRALELTQPASGLEPAAPVLPPIGRYALKAQLTYDPVSANVQQVQKPHDSPTSYVWGYQQSLPIAQVQQATSDRIAYTSFEPEATGTWQYNTAGPYPAIHFTGTRGYELNGTTINALRRSNLPAGEYLLVLWGHGPAIPQITGPIQQRHQEVARAGDWHQHRFWLSLPTNGMVEVNTAAGTLLWVDEARLHPVGAQMTSYTHDPMVGETSKTDPSGRTLTYEYDAVGRLVRTRDEQGRLLSQQEYHYARP